jgi:hypothetical protein
MRAMPIADMVTLDADTGALLNWRQPRTRTPEMRSEATMGDLTSNFSRHEVACKGKQCCGHSAPTVCVCSSGNLNLKESK